MNIELSNDEVKTVLLALDLVYTQFKLQDVQDLYKRLFGLASKNESA